MEHRGLVHQLSEATAVGSTFAVPAAVDPDSRRNGVARYELRPADGAFRLSVRQNAAADSDLRVVLVDKLDREDSDRYQVTRDAFHATAFPHTRSGTARQPLVLTATCCILHSVLRLY